MADEYLPQIVFTVEETAARGEAEQLHISQSRSTETVDKLQLGGKPNSFMFAFQANRDGRRREADRLRTSRACDEETEGEALQRPDEKISVRQLLQGW